MDTPMLLPAHRASRPLILTPWQRVTNAVCWCVAGTIAQPILAWDHFRAMSWRCWLDLPGHLLGFAIRALAGIWGLSILLAAAGAILAIPVGILWMLSTLALRWLGW